MPEYPDYVSSAKYHDPEQYVHCCGKDILRAWIAWHIREVHS
jgi:hypothetical protein